MSECLYWIILVFLLFIMLYIIVNDILADFADKLRPKYRLDENGYLQFYYRRFSRWEYFPIWNDNIEQRYVKVFDKIRNLEYTLSYIGPGRAKIKYIFDDNAPITRNFITNHFRKIYPEFKNSKQLWNLHELYINKESTILNNIIDNYIFTACKINGKIN